MNPSDAYSQWLQQSGSSPQDALGSILSQYSGAKAVAPKGNFITRNLNNIGGAGGALGGAALGTAILPGLGTLLGGLAGGFLGGAGGQAAKAATTGQSQNLGQDLIQGAEGAGGSLLGEGIGKVGGSLIGKLTKPVAGAIDKTGNKLLASSLFGGASKNAQIDQKAASTAAALGKYGVHAGNIGSVIPQVTGAAGGDPGTAILSNAVRNALTSANPVDIGKSMPVIGRIAGDLNVSSPGAGDALAKQVTDLIDNARPEGRATLSGVASNGTNNLNANDVFDIQHALENRAYSKGVGAPQSTAYKQLADHFGQVLGESGANDVVSKGVLSPEDLSTLHSIHPQLAEQAANAKTVGDLRSLQAPFVRGNLLLNDIGKQAEALGQSATKTAPTSIGQVPAKLAGALLNHPSTKRMAGNALKTVTGNGTGKTANLLGMLTGATKAVVPAAAGQGLAEQFSAQPAEAPTTLAPATETPDATSSETPTASSGSIFTPQLLQALAIADIQNTGGKNLSSIATLDSLFGPSAKDNQPVAQTAAQSKEADAIRSAAGAVNTSADQLSSAGGANPFENLLSEIPVIGKYIAPNVAAYNSTKKDAGAALASATVGGGKPPASVIKAFTDSLPSASNSPAEAKQKVTNILQQLTRRGQIYGVDPSELQQ